MSKVFIGIDNGVTGSIGIIREDSVEFFETPIITQQNYTKKKANISRIDFNSLCELFEPFQGTNCFVLLERPMVNPMRFMASTSALRALEATLIIIEQLHLPFSYIDSKEWQKALLPQGIKGEELKKASIDIGSRLFPQFIESFKKHKDADGLLIAEYCRRTK